MILFKIKSVSNLGETSGTTYLEHIVTNASDAAVFNCPGGTKWQYQAFGSTTYKLGSHDVRKSNNHYTDSYVVQKMGSQNGTNLKINSTRREDAGTFNCLVYANDTGYTTSAELVILGKHYVKIQKIK